jgi:hypothetical protein
MSSALNVVQLEATRRNAKDGVPVRPYPEGPTPAIRAPGQGPKTEAGKKTSSLNALRHSLTARVVVLPTEDLAAYKSFSEEFIADLAPETFAERQCAQTIIDTQWRLNRVRSIEDGMLALGHFGPEGRTDPGHPEIHAVLTAAAVYRGHSQAFANLSMHEQRLYRILRDASKSLEDMKSKRIAAAVAPHNLNKTEDLPDEPSSAGFVFANVGRPIPAAAAVEAASNPVDTSKLAISRAPHP